MKKSFTLIELLLVVAIIAILSSILLPALGKARGMAKKIYCAGNHKQLWTGINLYIPDYDDYFVLGGYDINNRWYHYTNRYLNNELIFKCPASKEFSFGSYINLGYNIFHLGRSDWYGGGIYEPCKTNFLKKPSETLMICDTWDVGNPARGYYYMLTYSWTNAGAPAPIHNNTMNILWADGHCDSMTGKSSEEFYLEKNLGSVTSGTVNLKDTKWDRN
jgi:prepilin-type processing-associated H-X9-DG protein/prepilin-type N-terminal cleavage/methylation domain-containing protein